MKKGILTYTIFTFLLLISSVRAQDTLQLNLTDVVDMARSQSLDAKSAAVQKVNAEWQWRLFQSELLPKLNMNLTALNFQQAVQPIVQQDGSINFLEIAQNRSSATLEVQQLIPFTGGNVFVRTNLERFDNFSNDAIGYGGSPLEIGLSQPLFAYNRYRWLRKLAPVRYEEARLGYSADLEQSAYDAVLLFFALSLNQINREIAFTNLSTNKSVVNIAKEKYTMGKISKDEYLQAQVLLKNSEIETMNANLRNAEAVNELKTHLMIKGNTGISLSLPDELPIRSIDFQEVWSRCQTHSVELIRQQRRLLEVKDQEAQVRGETGITGSLTASLGYAAQSNDISDYLNNTNNLQTVGLQINIPILDWGAAKARRKRVEARRMLVEQNIEQEKADFKQEVIALVGAYNTLKDQLPIVKQSKELAEERFVIAKGRYIAGDIKLIELNLAMTQKDTANRSYVDTLRLFWLTFYRLRIFGFSDFI